MNNFVSKGPTLIVRNSTPSDCHLFVALKQNRGVHVVQCHDLENMADNIGKGLISTGNRKARSTV